jgi:hypothetical protein
MRKNKEESIRETAQIDEGTFKEGIGGISDLEGEFKPNTILFDPSRGSLPLLAERRYDSASGKMRYFVEAAEGKAFEVTPGSGGLTALANPFESAAPLERKRDEDDPKKDRSPEEYNEYKQAEAESAVNEIVRSFGGYADSKQFPKDCKETIGKCAAEIKSMCEIDDRFVGDRILRKNDIADSMEKKMEAALIICEKNGLFDMLGAEKGLESGSRNESMSLYGSAFSHGEQMEKTRIGSNDSLTIPDIARIRQASMKAEASYEMTLASFRDSSALPGDTIGEKIMFLAFGKGGKAKYDASGEMISRDGSSRYVFDPVYALIGGAAFLVAGLVEARRSGLPFAEAAKCAGHLAGAFVAAEILSPAGIEIKPIFDTLTAYSRMCEARGNEIRMERRYEIEKGLEGYAKANEEYQRSKKAYDELKGSGLTESRYESICSEKKTAEDEASTLEAKLDAYRKSSDPKDKDKIGMVEKDLASVNQTISQKESELKPFAEALSAGKRLITDEEIESALKDQKEAEGRLTDSMELKPHGKADRFEKTIMYDRSKDVWLANETSKGRKGLERALEGGRLPELERLRGIRDGKDREFKPAEAGKYLSKEPGLLQEARELKERICAVGRRLGSGTFSDLMERCFRPDDEKHEMLEELRSHALKDAPSEMREKDKSKLKNELGRLIDLWERCGFPGGELGPKSSYEKESVPDEGKDEHYLSFAGKEDTGWMSSETRKLIAEKAALNEKVCSDAKDGKEWLSDTRELLAKGFECAEAKEKDYKAEESDVSSKTAAAERRNVEANGKDPAIIAERDKFYERREELRSLIKRCESEKEYFKDGLKAIDEKTDPAEAAAAAERNKEDRDRFGQDFGMTDIEPLAEKSRDEQPYEKAESQKPEGSEEEPPAQKAEEPSAEQGGGSAAPEAAPEATAPSEREPEKPEAEKSDFTLDMRPLKEDEPALNIEPLSKGNPAFDIELLKKAFMKMPPQLRELESDKESLFAKMRILNERGGAGGLASAKEAILSNAEYYEAGRKAAKAESIWLGSDEAKGILGESEALRCKEAVGKAEEYFGIQAERHSSGDIGSFDAAHPEASRDLDHLLESGYFRMEAPLFFRDVGGVTSQLDVFNSKELAKIDSKPDSDIMIGSPWKGIDGTVKETLAVIEDHSSGGSAIDSVAVSYEVTGRTDDPSKCDVEPLTIRFVGDCFSNTVTLSGLLRDRRLTTLPEACLSLAEGIRGGEAKIECGRNDAETGRIATDVKEFGFDGTGFRKDSELAEALGESVSPEMAAEIRKTMIGGETEEDRQEKDEEKPEGSDI